MRVAVLETEGTVAWRKNFYGGMRGGGRLEFFCGGTRSPGVLVVVECEGAAA
jgi:hypothetical protein